MKNHFSKIIVFLVIVMVCTLTIGYSAFGTELSISKVVANVRVQKDVRITNVELADGNATGENDINFDSDSVVGDVFLLDSTDYITLNVTITNFGNVDMYIYDMASSGELHAETIEGGSGNVVPALGGTHEVLLYVFPESFDGARDYSFKASFNFQRIFTITFEGIDIDDGMAVENEPYNIYLGEELANDIEIYMDNVLLDDSKYLIDYGQLIIKKVTGNVVIKKREKVAKLVSGTLTTPGSEICIKDECFYLMSNDGTTIKMLSKYNLHVGYQYGDSLSVLTTATGRQSPDAVGWFQGYFGNSPIIGNIAFSNDNYWVGNVSSYPAYVYNEKSNAYSYLEGYRDYLKSLNLRIKAARLITYDEVELLGCSGTTQKCNSLYSWIYSTSYWTGVVQDEEYVWAIGSDAEFDCYDSDDGNRYNTNHYFGVRPVIEISTSEVSEFITFTIGGTTYHADKDMTWAQWVDSEYNTGTVYLYYDIVKVGAGSNLLLNDTSVNSGDRIISGSAYSIDNHHAGGSND